MSSVIVPKSRDEVLKSFSPLLQKHLQQAAQPATKAEAAERVKLREAVERAAQYTSETIIKGLAELQVSFGVAVEALAERLASEASKLDELRRAIAAESARVEDLRHVRIAAEAVEFCTAKPREMGVKDVVMTPSHAMLTMSRSPSLSRSDNRAPR